eukprot:TRINITY_DN30537_c0_g1_i1.p1 TRINITY_DN30537_c0_g1~~TRINITY_DN30537_c0_g1_i1.p1  ORF type:complete len:337 (-),score=-0.37 TRINITY_DN30537_c0_g1_i1:40-1050(-)
MSRIPFILFVLASAWAGHWLAKTFEFSFTIRRRQQVRAYKEPLRPLQPTSTHPHHQQDNDGTCTELPAPSNWRGLMKEDVFLWEWVFSGPHGPFCNGRTFEVGAHDGYTISNTYVFRTRPGWESICVEPNPAMSRKITNCTHVLPIIVSDGVLDAMYLGYWWKGDGVYSKAIKKAHPRSRRVPTLTVSKVLDDVGWTHIDFFSLDVEGHELQVLHGINFTRHKVGIFCVEEKGDSCLLAKVRIHLLNNGYTLFHQDLLNSWWANSTFMDRFALPRQIEGTCFCPGGWEVTLRTCNLTDTLHGQPLGWTDAQNRHGLTNKLLAAWETKPAQWTPHPW